MALGNGAFVSIAVVIMVMGCSIQTVMADPNRFNDNFFVGWRPEKSWLSRGGHTINMKLDNETGSGFQSYNTYLHGYVSMRIKLPPSNSAGVVVAYYMSSYRANTTIDWDEIDFEFLGNVSGQPWICQTNVFTNGTGGREKRIFLWFDPTSDYHTYSIIWNTQQIIWLVDSVPIRVYRNTYITAPTFPSWKPMRIFSSIWDGDSWATRGGLEKIDWSYAPFIASYTDFDIDACIWNYPNPPSTCVYDPSDYWWNYYSFSKEDKYGYTYFTSTFTVYDYCQDYKRYPVQMPECQTPPWD